MADRRNDFVTWLQKQPDWLQLAAERLLDAKSPSDVNLQPIVDRLKTDQGQAYETSRPFTGITQPSGAKRHLRILEISDIRGIENLNPRSPLDFGYRNLTVIYGHNGSGKSGYVRTIKRASGHFRANDLSSNVYTETPANRQCTIKYELDGTTHPVDWPANGPSISDLKPVDVFDADAARFYLTEEKEVSYTPPEIALIDDLATLCSNVGNQLRSERNALTNQLPQLPPKYRDTPASIEYQSLAANIDPHALTRLTEWTPSDQDKIERLTARLNEPDPAGAAARKRKQKNQIIQLKTALEKAASTVTSENLSEIASLRQTAQHRRRIAIEGTRVDSAHLEGIGTDTWNALWAAARRYSQTAYPNRDFPAASHGDRCVLCHQPLDADARSRLRDFEDYVQSTLEQQARDAEGSYEKALNDLVSPLSDDDLITRCEAAGITDQALIDSIRDLLGRIRRSITAAHEHTDALQSFSVPFPSGLIATLSELEESAEHEAQDNDGDATGFDRAAIERERLALEARKWTSEQAEAINDELARLQQIKQYDEWIKLANPRSVSIMANRLSETVITEAYAARFNNELSALGAGRLKVEIIRSRTEIGSVLHRLRLTGVSTDDDEPDKILSDGERRIVSLAAFLADIAENPHNAPCLFDDPISSLDQDFEFYTACRLAELSKERQVIIFTHRLSLYGSMEDAAKKVTVNVEKRCIESVAGSSGQPTDNSLLSLDTKKANNDLVRRLAEAKTIADQGDIENYRYRVQTICTDFRKLLERTVEDDLLRGVVKRHRRSVTTDNKIRLLSIISPDDCQLLDDLMTKYSVFEHSQSPETPAGLPDEEELRNDLTRLKSWREEFKKTLKQAQELP